MFNTSYYDASSHISNVSINAVTGAILKNHPKSWFERFSLCSARASQLLKEGGHQATKKAYKDNGFSFDSYDVADPDKDITVLQMVICGDMEVMAELVYTKDYEMKVC